MDGATLFVSFMEREATVFTIAQKVINDLSTEEDVVPCNGQANHLLVGTRTASILLQKRNSYLSNIIGII